MLLFYIYLDLSPFVQGPLALLPAKTLVSTTRCLSLLLFNLPTWMECWSEHDRCVYLGFVLFAAADLYSEGCKRSSNGIAPCLYSGGCKFTSNDDYACAPCKCDYRKHSALEPCRCIGNVRCRGLRWSAMHFRHHRAMNRYILVNNMQDFACFLHIVSRFAN